MDQPTTQSSSTASKTKSKASCPKIHHVFCLREIDFQELQSAVSNQPDWELTDSYIDKRIKELTFKVGRSTSSAQGFLNTIQGFHLFALSKNKAHPYNDQVRDIEAMFLNNPFQSSLPLPSPVSHSMIPDSEMKADNLLATVNSPHTMNSNQHSPSSIIFHSANKADTGAHPALRDSPTFPGSAILDKLPSDSIILNSANKKNTIVRSSTVDSPTFPHTTNVDKLPSNSKIHNSAKKTKTQIPIEQGRGDEIEFEEP